ncbi:uncharacterized protein K02A2.6-like [Macrosteles quadrilineatus]|uniref:uncharacterized protein K02A2.6-like n=1 Tax=Macrosteles quadrilineatus TaxID=74068 RepID=UPI0023E1B9BD|nr:uncharacterized protein K02A2.6-like [Macrosteles quadrilineatus]
MAATRLQHYAIFLQAFSFDIKYKSTKDNVNADALSRLPKNVEEAAVIDSADVYEIEQIYTLPVTAEEIAKNTQSDPDLRDIYQSLIRGEPIHHPMSSNEQEWSIQLGCLLKGNRVVIPKQLRARILKELHEAHVGIVRMKGLARSYVWWPKIDADIENMTLNCLGCQRVQHESPKAPVHHWEYPSRPMQRIHVDFAGPFYGHYFLLIVDAYSKWPEIVTLTTINSHKTIEALRKFFGSFGIPDILVSDNGRQFVSLEFEKFLKSNGIRHKRSAPYHPATNGQVERYVQDLKDTIRAMHFEEGSIEIKLQRYLMAYRRAPHSTTGQSPSHLFIGRQIRSRLDLLYPDLSQKMNQKFDTDCDRQKSFKAQDRDRQKSFKAQDRDRQKSFKAQDPVAYRLYGTCNKWGFGKINKKEGPRNYEITTSSGPIRRHQDQIRRSGRDLCEFSLRNEQNQVFIPTNFGEVREEPTENHATNYHNINPEANDPNIPDDPETSNNMSDVPVAPETSNNMSDVPVAPETSNNMSDVPVAPASAMTVRRSKRTHKPVDRLNL